MTASVHRSQALLDKETWKRLQHPGVLSRPPSGELRLKVGLASRPPSGERAAGRLKRGLASRPPSGEPAASGKPGEPAALGGAGRVKGGLASWPPSGEPAAYCSLKAVLNFGFGLRPWGSPPAVALANF